MQQEKLTTLILLLPDEVLEALDKLCSGSGCTREEMAAKILARGVVPDALSS